jgi:hypothetical protein
MEVKPQLYWRVNSFNDRLKIISIRLATMPSGCAFHIRSRKMVKDLKVKDTRVHVVKAYRGCRSTTPLILNLDAR